MKNGRRGEEFSYDGNVGRWWMARAADAAHQRAYNRIAVFIRESTRRSPRLIADYACGPGDLLARLGREFPRARLTGLDGSSLLLEQARRKLSCLQGGGPQRMALIETPLPARGLLKGRADLAIYCFPNMMPTTSQEGGHFTESWLSERDREIANALATATDPLDEGDEAPDPPAAKRMLEYNRGISKNLRQMLVRGGLCFRVEYAASRRHEWPPLELMQVCFEEGSLDMPVHGLKPRAWFRVLASVYFGSRVMEDVFQQTGDPRDRAGGFLITVLKAI